MLTFVPASMSCPVSSWVFWAAPALLGQPRGVWCWQSLLWPLLQESHPEQLCEGCCPTSQQLLGRPASSLHARVHPPFCPWSRRATSHITSAAKWMFYSVFAAVSGAPSSVLEAGYQGLRCTALANSLPARGDWAVFSLVCHGQPHRPEGNMCAQCSLETAMLAPKWASYSVSRVQSC